jgi:glycosyltransferase involved in cell wall biosynthesis
MNHTREQHGYEVLQERIRRVRPTRVVHVLWNGEIGGAERAVYQLVRAQVRQGDVEPAILFAQGRGHYWKESQALGCDVINLELSHGHAIEEIFRVARAMRAFDVHHFHSAEPLLMLASVLGTDAMRVYTHRGGFIRYGLAKRLRHEVTGVLLRRHFHAFSGNTQHGAHAAASLYRLPFSSLEVIYNGVDFNLLQPRRSANAVRSELHLDRSNFVLGTAATLKAWKRIDRLVDLVADMGIPSLRVVVLGDGPERKRLEARAEERQVAGTVIFTGSILNVADYLQVMDAFCLPSMGLESFGNAAVEAMGMGVPTLVFSDGGGLTEHIVNGRNGFVVRDPRGLAETVNRLMIDSQLRREIGQNASDDVRAHYRPADTAAAYLSLYKKAIVSSDARQRLEDGNQ